MKKETNTTPQKYGSKPDPEADEEALCKAFNFASRRGDAPEGIAPSKSQRDHTQSMGPNGAKIKPTLQRLPHNFDLPPKPPGKQATEAVKAIGQLKLTGNLVPREWLGHLRLLSGLSDTVAALVLAEIVFWYRPNDEGERKFSDYALQKTNAQLSESLHLSERQVKDAVFRLETSGIIKREFYDVPSMGRSLSHVQFLTISPMKIAELGSPLPRAYDVVASQDSDVVASELRPCAVRGQALGRQTCTESTQRAPQRAPKNNKRRAPHASVEEESIPSVNASSSSSASDVEVVIAETQEVMGEDFSPALIQLYRKKLSSGKFGPPLDFLTGLKSADQARRDRLYPGVFWPFNGQKMVEKPERTTNAIRQILTDARTIEAQGQPPAGFSHPSQTPISHEDLMAMGLRVADEKADCPTN